MSGVMYEKRERTLPHTHVHRQMLQIVTTTQLLGTEIPTQERQGVEHQIIHQGLITMAVGIQ